MINNILKNSRAFSLLELLIMMAILAILSSGAAIWFFGYQRQAEVDSSSKMIVDALRDTQSRSISGKDFKPWGVCFDAAGGKFVLFRNDCNNNGAADNGETGIDCGGGGCFDCDLKCNGASVGSKEENYLSFFAKVGNVTLSGGGNKIIFNNPGGGTAQYGTIRIIEAGNVGNFRDINVSSIGKIENQ